MKFKSVRDNYKIVISIILINKNLKILFKNKNFKKTKFRK